MATTSTLTVITDGKQIQLTSEIDRTILDVLMDAGITDISAPCGGNGLCGKCTIQVIEGGSQEIHADEKRLLTTDQLEAGLRLACRMKLAAGDDLTIALLDSENEAQVVATYQMGEASKEGRREFAPHTYGCAIDIGTTTVVVYLVRLDTQEIIDNRSHMNPQRAYGGDVISRIQYAGEHSEGLTTLQRSIVKQLSSMVDDLISSHQIPSQNLIEIVAVGNPTMLHLLVGADPAGIAVAPFTPAFITPKELIASSIGFTTDAKLVLPGSVSAYIGSDVTVGVLATGFMEHPQRVLYIDIGTNGEIVLWDGKKLYCCSSAAGPAFEGASIRQGLGAIPGAVDRIWLGEDGRVASSTIGGKPAKGICGSAIIDVMALLLETGLVDETGAMDENHPLAATFLVDSPDGNALRITDTVSFTNRDVREVQLAKAAIAAGSEILLMEAGLKVSDIDMVVIAGGFGSYIDSTNAQRIGLLPPVGTGKIVTAGNAAGKGALGVLMHTGEAEQVEVIRRCAHYIELSSSLVFQERYVEQMFFGEV